MNANLLRVESKTTDMHRDDAHQNRARILRLTCLGRFGPVLKVSHLVAWQISQNNYPSIALGISAKRLLAELFLTTQISTRSIGGKSEFATILTAAAKSAIDIRP